MSDNQWKFELKRCLDFEGNLNLPEHIPLDALMDIKKLMDLQIQLSVITQMEASLYLYEENFPMPLLQDALPMLVQSPLCRELNKLTNGATGLPRCMIDTWQASLKAMREQQPVSADCIGGMKTLWSCPILLTFQGRSYPKASLTVAAFPILNFFSCQELEGLFPGGSSELREKYQNAFDLSLDGEKLKGVRNLVQLMAQAFSAEISARYEYAYQQVYAPQSRVAERPGDGEKLRQLIALISKVSHDLNNRLTSVNLYAQILRNSLVDDREAVENLGMIRIEAKEAIEAVRQLANYARNLLHPPEPSVAVSETPTPTIVPEAPVEGKRLLVVDDEKAVADLIKRVLESHSYAVDTSLDGETAIAMIEKRSYDLIVADLKMPGFGGIELFQHFSRVNPAIAHRMVFLSGDVISLESLSFLRETKSLHLTKPCTIEELLGFVKTALEKVKP